jgi:hypothetical protein
MFNSLKDAYLKDVGAAIRNKPAETEIVTEARLQELPDPVQRYLRYAGVPGRERCYNMHLVFKGKMREKGRGWINFSSEQYNFFDTPARFFYMKARL